MVIGSTGMLGAGLVHHFTRRGLAVRPLSRREFAIGRDLVSGIDLGGVERVAHRQATHPLAHLLGRDLEGAVRRELPDEHRIRWKLGHGEARQYRNAISGVKAKDFRQDAPREKADGNDARARRVRRR